MSEHNAFDTVVPYTGHPDSYTCALCHELIIPGECLLGNAYWPAPDKPAQHYLCPKKQTDPTNPKDAVGATKVPLSMFPAAGRIYGALAIADGAKKYGPANWRATKVRLTVYIDAMERHLAALRDGEDCAADSGIHHLGHVLAGAAIVMDALGCGTLIDDRPQAGPASKLLQQFTKERS